MHFPDRVCCPENAVRKFRPYTGFLSAGPYSCLKLAEIMFDVFCQREGIVFKFVDEDGTVADSSHARNFTGMEPEEHKLCTGSSMSNRKDVFMVLFLHDLKKRAGKPFLNLLKV